MKAQCFAFAALVAALSLTAGAANAALTPSNNASSVTVRADSSDRLVATNFVSTRSAADVRAEAIEASHHGVGHVDGSDYELMMQMFMSRLSRAQVSAVAVNANRANLNVTLFAMNGGGN